MAKKTLLKKNKILGKKTNVWLVYVFFRVSAPCSWKPGGMSTLRSRCMLGYVEKELVSLT